MGELDQELRRIRGAVCDRFLLAVSALVPPILVITWVRSMEFGAKPASLILVGLALLLCLVAIARHRLPLPLKGGAAITCFLLGGLAGLMQFGLLAAAPLILLVAPLMGAILFGRRIGLAVLGLCLLGMGLVAVQTIQSSRLPGMDLDAYMLSPGAWANLMITFLFIAGIVNYTFRGQSESLIRVLADSLSKERQLSEALVQQAQAEKTAAQSQKVALVALADLAEYRDTDTGDHVLRVARMSHDIARFLVRAGKIPQDQADEFLEHIGQASILHDVGKVSIPDSILLKPGKLTPEERTVMEAHADAGGAILGKAARMLPDSVHFRLAREIANHHHEHWDGSGYPSGLSGEAIPLSARIVAVSDVFDALTAQRPYKQPWTVEDATDFVLERSGKQFDPTVVLAFQAVLEMRKDCPVIEWSEAIAIGHPDVDHDHRILVQLVNQIASSELAEDPPSVRYVLAELIDYTRYHFAREEELLREAGYPQLGPHHHTHDMMIEQIQDLQERFQSGDEAVGSELSQILVTWLVNHIMQEDRQYRPWLVKAVEAAQ